MAWSHCPGSQLGAHAAHPPRQRPARLLRAAPFGPERKHPQHVDAKERLRRGGSAALATTCPKSPSSLPVDLPRHFRPTETQASSHRCHASGSPPAAAGSCARQACGATCAAAAGGGGRGAAVAGRDGQGEGVHSETAVVKRHWLYYACTCTCTNI